MTGVGTSSGKAVKTMEKNSTDHDWLAVLVASAGVAYLLLMLALIFLL